MPHSTAIRALAPSSASIESWGRVSVPGVEHRSEDLERLTLDSHLSRGLGRSYGDANLPLARDGAVAGTTLADRFLSWDPHRGVLRVEAGLPLHQLVRTWLPRGWFVPVTPGTAFVTLGGMVASDVHGKNHHVAGCLGEHITALRLRLGDGRIVECSPFNHPDLFWATVGGMGLTGHILEVELRMERVPSPWIHRQSERVPDIDTFVALLKERSEQWPMTVGWIDCITQGRHMGRGHLFSGRWALPEEAPRQLPAPRRRITVPDLVPAGLLGRWTVKLANSLIYWSHLRPRSMDIAHPEDFFYPLDRILRWNRLYGKTGLTQYQCVLPDSAGPDIARRFLELLTRLGGSSFLCVIKNCGPQGRGMLSFPMPGISIALDIPLGERAQSIVDHLNEFTLAAGGRIYLAKDLLTRPEHFHAMEPRLKAFQAVRHRWDPQGSLRSALSSRMFGD
jgi:FAD/FMN-containing dehydrogenase